MDDPPEQLSPYARAHAAVSRVTSVAFGMIVPGLLGYWVDQQLGLLPWLTIIGFAFGLAFGIWRLSHLAAKQPSDQQPKT